ncbi:MAG: hypothetical protein E7672_00890 [Ruminococcaceae bacterium]|nr:hypothetical protein [Oscillospiraceae bacterium]
MDHKNIKHENHTSHSNVVVKVLCVLAAFVLWIYVMSVESPDWETTFSHIVVQLENADELVTEKNLAIYNGYGTMIDVTLAGKKSVVSKIREEDIVVTADVSSIGSVGRYNCKIKVDTPAGCKLVGMSQETISVYVDKSEQISVDLSEQRENTKLPEGCYTGTIDFPVDKVSVIGPSNVLSRIEGAVVNLDLSGVFTTTTVTQKVTLIGKNGEEITSPYIDYYPKEVTVTVPILKTVTMPVPVSFKYGYLNSNNTRIALVPSTVTVTGDAAIINQGNLISPIEIDEKNEFNDGVCVKNVILDAVKGVKLSAYSVDVTAVVDPLIKTREIAVPGTNITDTGAKDGVNYTWDHSTVNVTIMGEMDKIAKITADDISLVLDMSPYSVTNTGTIKVKADVEIDSTYSDDIIEIGTYEISVTFEN